MDQHDFPRKLRVELTQFKADGTERARFLSDTMNIRNPRSEQDLLFKTAQGVEKFAKAMLAEIDKHAKAFKTAKGNGKKLPCAFSLTAPCVIRVTYGEDHDEQKVAMTTKDYTSNAMCEYRLTLKKLASGEGRAVLMASFRLTKTFCNIKC